MTIFSQTFIETLREQIMDNDDTVAVVSQYATQCLEHFESMVDMITDQDVKDELFCQYQNQAWNKLFNLLGCL